MTSGTKGCAKAIGRALSIAAMACLAAAVSSPAYAQFYREDFVLRPGEDSREWVYRFTDPSTAELRGTLVGPLADTVVLDVAISPACRSNYELEIYELTAANAGQNRDAGVLVHQGFEYRTTLPVGASSRYINVDPVAVNVGRDDGPPYLRDCEVKVRLYRPLTVCTMSATVTGDLNGSYFGDIAFFNYFPEGAPITFGTALDPTAVDILDGILGAAVAGQNLTSGGTAGQPPSFGDAIRQWAAESEAQGDEPVPGSGDKFGLSLVGITGSTGAIDPTNPQNPQGRLQRAEDSLLQSLFKLSSFSLAASGMPGELFDAWLAEGAERPFGEPTAIELSVVHMWPGDMDANLDGVKFVGQHGDPGRAVLIVTSPWPNVLVGRVIADLQTVRPYNGRRLRVQAVAEFVARRGAYSCDLR